MTLLGALDRSLVDAIAGTIRVGRLTLVFPSGKHHVYEGNGSGPAAEVRLHDPKLVRRLVTVGAIGLADGYIDGDFDTPDLPALIELAARNVERRSELPEFVDRILRAIWRHLGGAAAPRGPLDDIVQHYDLDNKFFGLWLDPTMTYSSATFVRDDMTLEEAQEDKYRRLAAATGIRQGDAVLEIGCGWGGFAVYAAKTFGARVTAITVSKEQFDYVGKLVADRGLSELVETRLEDFRDTRGTFDRIVSIEMLESVPRRMWSPYFGHLRRLIGPHGSIGLQVITIADRHWQTSDRNPDFARRYVFPGGQVPALKILRDLARIHALDWLEDRAYGDSYARTLRSWREEFEANEPQIASLGFDERFRRMWRYYLSYCEGGFRAGRVDVRQIVLARGASSVPS